MAMPTRAHFEEAAGKTGQRSEGENDTAKQRQAGFVSTSFPLTCNV